MDEKQPVLKAAAPGLLSEVENHTPWESKCW